MRKYLIMLIILGLFFGCVQKKDKKVEILAKINNYEITKEEFEQEFKESAFARQATLESRKEFLDNLINRKLILQDAQTKGLDKDKDFLKMVEKFWEQSLLKLALDRKAKEISGSVSISDKAIEEMYSKLLQEGKADKPYSKMYNQIKWELTKIQESKMMDEWIASLRKKANIKVNLDLLK